MDEWEEVSLGECAKFQEGYVNPPQGKTSYFDGPVKWLRAVDLNDGEVWNTSRTLTESGFLSAGKAAQLFQPGSLAISKSGTIGRIGLLRAPMCGNRAVINIRPDVSRCNPRIIFYALLLGRPQIEILAEGSVQKNLYVSALSGFRFRLPPRPEQDAIANVLTSLDDKIELNRRMNETLEGMAQAIFRDWFVDFGPTRRKAAGEADPVAIMGGLTPAPDRAAEFAALFPDAFGDDGLPVGWVERPLDAIADFLNGLALQKFPAQAGEPDLPVIKIAELRNGLSERTNRASRTVPAKYLIKDGDFIFSWSGSLMAKVWTLGEGALNQHLFKVSSDEFPQWFYGQWVNHHMPEFQLIAASKATTMGHIQRGHLSSATTVCPQDGAMEIMSSVMRPLWDRMVHNELENRTLAETRDYLLPRLMSGAVRIRSLVADEGH